MSTTDENATQFALLGLLHGRPMTGYDIKTAFDEVVNFFWSASYGQIYPELKRLVARGYATVREERSPNRPARKVYRITESGRQALRDWLAKAPATRPGRSEIALKLCFGAYGRIEDQIAHLEAFGAAHEQRLAMFREIERAAEAEAKPEEMFPLLTLRMGIALSEAMTRWAQESVRTLRESAGEGAERKAKEAQPRVRRGGRSGASSRRRGQ